MRVAVFDAPTGVSGDMTLGAFVDAGLPISYLRKELAKVNLRGYRLRVRETTRNRFRAKKFDVIARKELARSRAHWPDIQRVIRGSRLGRFAKSRALSIFEHLARAEARVHGMPVSRVNFHEVGAIDSVVDIVGSAIALDYFGIEKIFVAHLAVGRGMAQFSHGRFPVPAPATCFLLKGFRLERSEIEHELVTPTGAAILKAHASLDGAIPSIEVEAVGCGAGDADFSNRANVLRISVGRTLSSWHRERILSLQANIDDMLPLSFEPLSKRLFRQGALDVFVEPIYMKRLRPAYRLTVLSHPEDKAKLEQVLFRETPTLGVRALELERVLLDRKMIRVRSKYGPLQAKVGYGPGGEHLVVSPEYRDVERIASRRQVSFHTVYREGKKAALRVLRRKKERP